MQVLFKNKRVHFIGIGGIGMSGIARFLLEMGFPVQGSDLKSNKQTAELEDLGATFFLGHASQNIEGADVVVHTSACAPDNPEIVGARKKQVPVIQRAQMLAELMRLKFGIAVAGSHGKTTTTSMMGQILHDAGLDPSVVVGGKFRLFNSNVRVGKGDILLTEADESDGSFLHLNPAMAIVTNIDREHMNHYGSEENLHQSFLAFMNKIPFYGVNLICGECPVLRKRLDGITSPTLLYGFDSSFHYFAQAVSKDGLGTSFEVMENTNSPQDPRSLGRFRLRMPGQHNILNALGVIGLARQLDLQPSLIQQALFRFPGVERRLHYLLQTRDLILVDDYGHHPTEIRATIAALRENHPGRLVVLFQPHRYSRTKDLWDEFSRCFDHVDQLFLMDIYAAAESPIPEVTSEALAKAIRKATGQRVSDLGKRSMSDVLQTLRENLKPGDVLLTLGAGSTFDYACALRDMLEQERPSDSALQLQDEGPSEPRTETAPSDSVRP